MFSSARRFLILVRALIAAPAVAQNVQPMMTGDVRVHDPSVIEVGGGFAAFGTGVEGRTHGAIRVKTSADGLEWKDAGVIGAGPPAWARGALDGGGTLVLGTTGRFIGPGGQEAVRTANGDMLVYHYYDGDDAGAAKIQLSPLRWSPDGWPMLDPLP